MLLNSCVWWQIVPYRYSLNKEQQLHNTGWCGLPPEVQLQVSQAIAAKGEAGAGLQEMGSYGRIRPASKPFWHEPEEFKVDLANKFHCYFYFKKSNNMSNMLFILWNCSYFCLVPFCLLGKESHPFSLVQKSLENNYYTSHTKAYVKDSWEFCDQFMCFVKSNYLQILFTKFSEQKKLLTSVYGGRIFLF